MLTLALLTAIALTPDSNPADPCASRKPSAVVEAYVAVTPSRRGVGGGTAKAGTRDTVLTATVCVATRSSTTKVGSYHGELYFDSTAARVLRVERPVGGIRVENTTQAGRVNFAGAAPSGFPGGALLTVVLRVKQPGKVPALRLTMIELNATDGSNLMKLLVTTSASRKP